MLEIKRFDSPNEDFERLDALLNDSYVERFGDIALKYFEINSLKNMDDFFIAYDGDIAAAIICLKKFDEETGEVKRLFVSPEYRRTGLAMKMIKCCEERAKEIGYNSMMLETGAKMPEAIELYEKNGYNRIDNFKEYIGDDETYCMKKNLL